MMIDEKNPGAATMDRDVDVPVLKSVVVVVTENASIGVMFLIRSFPP